MIRLELIKHLFVTRKSISRLGSVMLVTAGIYHLVCFGMSGISDEEAIVNRMSHAPAYVQVNLPQLN